MPIFPARANNKREDFVGREDVYLSPYLTGDDVFTFDTLSQYINTHFRDMAPARLSRYNNNWRFYDGRQFVQAYKDGQEKFYVNLVRPFCDKSTDWLFKKPWDIETPAGNEGIKKVLDLVWGQNNKEVLSWKMGNMGAVTGDVFVFVTVRNYDPRTKKSIPLEDQRIEIKLINSSFVHPVFDPATDEITSVVIQFPTLIEDWHLGDGNRNNLRPGQFGMYTIAMTPETIHEFINSNELQELSRPNAFNGIPLVHIQNLPHSASHFGISDIDDTLKLNQEINSVVHSWREVLRYHGEPVTVIYGAKAANLEKAANKTWTLPAQARVETLHLNSNNPQFAEMYELLKTMLHTVGSTPRSSMEDSDVSNTSQASLEVKYMPLMEKTQRKYLTYGAGLAQVNYWILRILTEYFNFDLANAAGAEDAENILNTKIKFASPFPRDEEKFLQNLLVKKQVGVVSDLGALRDYGSKNPERDAMEIISDKRAQMLEDAERAKAANGQMPNMAAFSLSSLAVGNNLTDYFLELDTPLADSLALSHSYNDSLTGLVNLQQQAIAGDDDQSGV